MVRRRVFADFRFAHLMRFRRGIASGNLTLCPAMSHPDGCKKHDLCKQNVLLHLCEQFGLTAEHVLAVGDGELDACTLAAAGISVAFEPKREAVSVAAQNILSGSLLGILPLVGGAKHLDREASAGLRRVSPEHRIRQPAPPQFLRIPGDFENGACHQRNPICPRHTRSPIERKGCRLQQQTQE